MERIELSVENGLREWRLQKEPRKYQLGFSAGWKRAFAELTDMDPKEMGRALLDDFHKLAEDIHADELCLAISLKDPAHMKMARSLLVYGFEKVQPEEAAQITSSPDLLLLKMEINQEDDFVDLS